MNAKTSVMNLTVRNILATAGVLPKVTRLASNPKVTPLLAMTGHQFLDQLASRQMLQSRLPYQYRDSQLAGLAHVQEASHEFLIMITNSAADNTRDDAEKIRGLVSMMHKLRLETQAFMTRLAVAEQARNVAEIEREKAEKEKALAEAIAAAAVLAAAAAVAATVLGAAALALLLLLLMYI